MIFDSYLNVSARWNEVRSKERAAVLRMTRGGLFMYGSELYCLCS